MDVPTGPLLLPECSCAPAHRVIYVLQRGQPGGKKVLARSKRLHRFFIVVKGSPHGRDSSPRSLKSGCTPECNNAVKECRAAFGVLNLAAGSMSGAATLL
jgi:hypothetical protein